MATAMVAMDMLRTMMPLVHENDLEAALGDLRELCHKWNARREYRLELAAADVDILNGKIPRVNRYPERGPALPWTEKTTKDFVTNVKVLYCLVKNITAVDIDTEQFKQDREWMVRSDLVLAAANRRMCKDGAVKPRVAMERLRCLAQYCEMLQLDDAAKNYRRYIAEWVRTCDARVQSEELNKRCRDEAATSSSEDEQPPPKLARQNAVSDPAVDAPVEVEAEPEPAASAPVEVETETQGDGDPLEDGTDYAELLATARKHLRHEFVRLVELYDKDRAKFFTWKHGYPRFLMHALWLGVGEDDTLVPMRADFETARVGHEITIENDQVLFRTQECNKTKREIQFNVSKHCPAAANILLKIYKYAETECNGYLFPSLKDPKIPRSSRQLMNSRAGWAKKNEAFGLPRGKHNIHALRHISAAGRPPRSPEEARGMAYRRGSSVEAMHKYGSGWTHAASAPA